MEQPSLPSTAHPLDRRTMMGHYAGFVSRLMGFIIDVLLLSITIVFTSWFVSTSVNILQGWAILNTLGARYPQVADLVSFLQSPWLHSTVSVIFIIAYYLFFWTNLGQTPGKYLLGLRIVRRDGRKLRLRNAILRYLGYYLSAGMLGMGFFWILVDDERRGWHDRLAGTLVIYVWDARPDETFLVKLYGDLRQRQESLRKLLGRPKKRLAASAAPEEPGMIVSDSPEE